MRRAVAGLAVTVLLGCAGPAPETPEQGIEAIIALFEAGDFDSLVRTRYAEIHKAESEQQVQALVQRFEERFAGEAALGDAVATYESALQVAPEFSEDGTVATFRLGDGFAKLSRMPDGKWGFHL